MNVMIHFICHFYNLCNSPVEMKGTMTRNIAPKYESTRNPQRNPRHKIIISLFLTPSWTSVISSKRKYFYWAILSFTN